MGGYFIVHKLIDRNGSVPLGMTPNNILFLDLGKVTFNIRYVIFDSEFVNPMTIVFEPVALDIYPLTVEL